jgi:hypothetical protein
MDEDLKQYLEAMEARLMLRFNTGTESILNRLTALEGEVRNLRSEHAVTRATVLALPVTIVSALERPLLDRISGIEARVTKLESDPDGR